MRKVLKTRSYVGKKISKEIIQFLNQCDDKSLRCVYSNKNIKGTDWDRDHVFPKKFISEKHQSAFINNLHNIFLTSVEGNRIHAHKILFDATQRAESFFQNKQM